MNYKIANIKTHKHRMEVNLGKKQLGINMIASIVSYGSNLLISFIITPYLINTLGKEIYSFYPIANTIIAYIGVLSESMTSIASRFVTMSLAKEQNEDASRYFSSALAANIIISLIMIVPMLLIVVFLEHIMDVPINSFAAVKTLFALLFSAALTKIFAASFGIATFAKNRLDLKSLRELVTSGLRLILYVLFYTFFSPSLVYVGLVVLSVEVINIGFQLYYTKTLTPEIKVSMKHVQRESLMELVSASFWNMLNSAGVLLLSGMNIVMANVLYGASASGSFSIVQVIPSFLGGLIPLLSTLFFPAVTYYYAQNNHKALVAELKKAQKTICFFSCAVIVVFSYMGEAFFRLWTPDEDSAYLNTLLIWTMVPHFLMAIFWPLTDLNIAMNKVKQPAKLVMLLGCAAIVVTCVLSKFFEFGLYIIPLVSVAFEILWIAVYIPLYACKNLGIKWYTFYVEMLKVILAAIPTYLATRLICGLFVVNSWLMFFLVGAIAGSCALMIYGFVVFGKDFYAFTKNKFMHFIRTKIFRES